MTNSQDLKNDVKRSWKLKNAKVAPVMMKNLMGMMTKNLRDIKNHPWEYYSKQATVGSSPGFSDDPEESHRHKTLRTENFTAWSMNRDPLLKWRWML